MPFTFTISIKPWTEVQTRLSSNQSHIIHCSYLLFPSLHTASAYISISDVFSSYGPQTQNHLHEIYVGGGTDSGLYQKSKTSSWYTLYRPCASVKHSGRLEDGRISKLQVSYRMYSSSFCNLPCIYQSIDFSGLPIAKSKQIFAYHSTGMWIFSVWSWTIRRKWDKAVFVLMICLPPK